VGDIIKTIAGEHGLTPIVSPDLSGEAIDHIDQTSESDASFLTRLSQRFDALSTVKSGQLLFYKIGRGQSLMGHALSGVTIRRTDGDQHRFSLANRKTAGRVRAEYYDTAQHVKGEVTVHVQVDETHDKQQNKRQRRKIKGTPDTVKTLRHTYANQDDARRAAQAALDKIQRGVATFSLTLAHGRPELIPELPANVIGWKPEIDGTDWLITQVTHRLSQSGYVSEVEMELRLAADALREVEGDDEM
jgi:phage protein D